MKKVRQCSQCSSVDLQRVGENEYRCRYCGTVRYSDAGITSPSLPSGPPRLRVMLIGAIAALLVIAGVVVFLIIPSSAPGPGTGDATAPDIPGGTIEFGEETIEKEVAPTAVFSGVSEVPDVIGNVYFIGIYRNTGTVPIRQPMVTIVLFDDSGRKVASGRGYAIRDSLGPGEDTPVSILLTSPPKYARFEAIHEPQAPYSYETGRRPKLAFRRVGVRKARYTGYEVTGEVVNGEMEGVQFVNIIAVLLDGNGKIIGSGNGYLPEKSLTPGDYGPFRVGVTTVIGVPRSYRLDYSARMVPR